MLIHDVHLVRKLVSEVNDHFFVLSVSINCAISDQMPLIDKNPKSIFPSTAAICSKESLTLGRLMVNHCNLISSISFANLSVSSSEDLSSAA